MRSTSVLAPAPGSSLLIPCVLSTQAEWLSGCSEFMMALTENESYTFMGSVLCDKDTKGSSDKYRNKEE